MTDIFRDKGFRTWLDAQLKQPFLPAFLEYIRQQRVGVAKEAMKPGDTDIEKGQVLGFDWVLDLPNIILITDTETETSLKDEDTETETV